MKTMTRTLLAGAAMTAVLAISSIGTVQADTSALGLHTLPVFTDQNVSTLNSSDDWAMSKVLLADYKGYDSAKLKGVKDDGCATASSFLQTANSAVDGALNDDGVLAKTKTMLLSTTALYTNAISAVNGVGDFDDLHAWSAS